MITSMTGFGRSENTKGSISIAVEARSVNSRFLDVSIRSPKVLYAYEDEINRLVKKKCIRGRINISANLENLNSTNKLDINNDLFDQYLLIVDKLNKKLENKLDITISDIFKFPDLIITNDLNSEEEIKKIFMKVLNQALDDLVKTRNLEGENIYKGINKNLQNTKKISQSIEKIIIKNKSSDYALFKKKILEISSNLELDENRICQEVAIMVDKKDINEEIIRLYSHIKLFKKYLDSKASQGKKMNFVLQEMLREINTIGSKADNIKISHKVVDLKDEIEQMREQVQNIL